MKWEAPMFCNVTALEEELHVRHAVWDPHIVWGVVSSQLSEWSTFGRSQLLAARVFRSAGEESNLI